MRMIEEFVRVIAKIVLLKETKNYVDAKAELDNLSLLISGLGIKHLKSLGSEGIAQVFSLHKESEIEKIYCSARILKEEGLIFVAEGKTEESLMSLELSKDLFELISVKDFAEKQDSLNELEFLNNKITK